MAFLDSCLFLTIFQITSCASATYVVTRFATRSKKASDKKTGNRLTIACGIILGGLTIVFEISGGLKGLQSATIVGGVPFMLIMFLCIVSLVVTRKNNMVVFVPEPRVRFRNFGDSSLDFELLCWARRPEDRRRLVHELNRQIYKAFDAADIQIPFPQRDIHLNAHPDQSE